jgi:hypothetical protein
MPLVLLATAATAQPYESVGLRALGMGGAFVAVADDATATYWNPAGLATGRFFSILFDATRTSAGMEAVDGREASGRAGHRQSGTIIAVGTPPLGISYYRLTSIAASESPRSGPGQVADASDLRALRTSHVGITLVQTLVDRLHAGATLKYVRGEAASASLMPGPSAPLDVAGQLPDAGRGAFDLDAGLMADFGRFRTALAGRNLLRPSFTSPLGEALSLDRQVRAGVALLPTDRLTVSIDSDLTRSRDVTGTWRSLAVGAEQRVLRERVGLRTGVRFSTVGASRSVVTAGASVAVRPGVYADGYAAVGVGAQGVSGGGAGLRVVF